uniref:calmodulin-like n=1 Tax=Styela clava TaxID=7725 RepID=UPI0019395046|nr:calmodulin-like [Styela clava]XP_039267498.1 calmodulin-like [Styela clava]
MHEYLPKDKILDYRRQFNAYDPKKSGTILLEDVSKILKDFECCISEKEMHQILEVNMGTANENNNFVNFEEFITIASLARTICVTEDEILEIFQMFDKDKDGFISAAELNNLMLQLEENVSEEEVEEMIHLADQDGDGRVSYEEFVRLLTGSVQHTREETNYKLTKHEFFRCISMTSKTIDITTFVELDSNSDFHEFTKSKNTKISSTCREAIKSMKQITNKFTSFLTFKFNKN